MLCNRQFERNLCILNIKQGRNEKVIHSYQFYLAQFRDINFYLIYISQFQSLQIVCKRHWRWKTDPSTIAILPTQGLPMSTGLFFVLRDKIYMQCQVSSSRPMIGSNFPCFAIFVRSIPYFFKASYSPSGSTTTASKKVLLTPQKRKPWHYVATIQKQKRKP